MGRVIRFFQLEIGFGRFWLFYSITLSPSAARVRMNRQNGGTPESSTEKETKTSLTRRSLSL